MKQLGEKVFRSAVRLSVGTNNKALATLEEKLTLARSANDKLVEDVRVLSEVVIGLCKRYAVDPPKSFEELIMESTCKESIPNTSVEKLDPDMPQADVGTVNYVELGAMSFEGDIVDGAIASSEVNARRCEALKGEKVMFKNIDLEPKGKDLNATRGRFFTGIYNFKNDEEVIPARITFIRIRCPEMDTQSGNPKFRYDFTICLPKKTPRNYHQKSYYGNLDIVFDFLDAKNEVVFSKTAASLYGNNGTCTLYEDSGKDHALRCEETTDGFEDFFDVSEGKKGQDLLEKECMLLKTFPETQMQCFYFKAKVQILEAADTNQADEPTSCLSLFELVASELHNLSPEGQVALQAWVGDPNGKQSWYSDVDINIEFIYFSYEKSGFEELTQQCVKNIMNVPKTVFEIQNEYPEMIKCLAEECKLPELLRWARELE